MAMDLNAKAAYIRGMMNGMEFDPASKNGKIIAAMMDLLEEMAATVVEHDDALDQLYDEVEVLDEDLDMLVEDIYDEDFDDDDEDDEDGADTLYEVTCPNCGAAAAVDEDTLLGQELTCPTCGAVFGIEVEDEDESESTDKTED